MTDEWTDRVNTFTKFVKDVGAPYTMLILGGGLAGFLVYSLGHAAVNVVFDLGQAQNQIQAKALENQTTLVNSLVSQLEDQHDQIETRGSEHADMSEEIDALSKNVGTLTDAVRTLVDLQSGPAKNQPAEPTPGGT